MTCLSSTATRTPSLCRWDIYILKVKKTISPNKYVNGNNKILQQEYECMAKHSFWLYDSTGTYFHAFVAKADWKTHPWSLNMNNQTTSCRWLPSSWKVRRGRRVLCTTSRCASSPSERRSRCSSWVRKDDLRSFFPVGLVYSTPPACQRFINYAAKLL